MTAMAIAHHGHSRRRSGSEMKISRILLTLTAVAATCVLSACSLTSEQSEAGDDAPSEPEQSSATGVEVISSDLDAPWSIAFHDRTPLVSERDSGRILELDSAGESREVGTVEDISPAGEGGLLGIAVHEDSLYTYFTASGDNRIVRYELEGRPGAFSLGDPETILEGLPAANFHNGGRIAFGPDEMLYATVGDAGESSRAQDRDALSGKILRMTPGGGVPADNPLDDSLVYSWGHRNPQGIAWSADGTMYASEFGQDAWDELNVIEAGSNYGWPEVEGIAEGSEFVDPVRQWKPAEASPSGIAITDGTIHIANLRGERLREVPLDSLAEANDRLTGEQGRLRDVVVAPDDSLWVLTNNTDGRGDPGPDDDRILRVEPAD